MAASAPWSVKGIDPKAREIAKDLARRSGMTLGEWLNQMILDDGAADEASPLPGLSSPTPVPPPGYQRFEAPEHPGDDVLRASEALDRLSARIEAAEHRSTLAISGIDQSVSGVLSRLESTEREQIAVAARFEGAVADLTGEQARLAARLRQVEQEASGSRSVEAVRSMESALAKVASHLYDGEAKAEQRFADLRGELDGINDRLAARPAGEPGGGDGEAVERLSERLGEAEDRTTAAMRALEASFAQLDERLNDAQGRMDGRAAEASLEQLAASLSARVDEVRAEMTEKIREAADGRFDRMERTLNEMTGHVEIAERRSAQAIERMGHEVLRMADTLGRRVQDVENRSADSIEQVGGEVARMASGMETRLNRSDEAGAQALEKLGGEIARITERLAERIANAERRSAQAMDDVGEQVSRVSERLQDRQERTSTELSERIRLSEERTARLLEDARERIDSRLEETQRRLTEAQAPSPMSFDQTLFVDPEVGPFGRERYDEPAPPYAEPVSRTFVDPEVAPFRDDDFEPVAETTDFMPATRFEPETPELPSPSRFEPETARFDEDTRLLHPEPRAFADLDPDDLIAPARSLDDDVFAAEALLAPAEPDATTPVPEETRAEVSSVFDETPVHAEFSTALKTEIDHHDPDHHETDHLAADHPETSLEAADAEAEAEPQPELDIPPAAPLSTRELIEQARAAARAANLGPPGKNGTPGGGMFNSKKDDKKPKRHGPSTLATALFVSGGAAALSMALVGYELVLQHPNGALPTRVAEALGLGAPATPLGSERPAAGEGGQPMAALALAPSPTAPNTGPVPTAAQSEAGAEIYADGVRRVEAHDNSGVDGIRKAANLGYAPAEFYLAKLYESGGAGLKKDIVEARVWTERAAEAGDQKAMHNLALYNFEGTGGPKNLTLAAQWFRRAADLGLVDSQYNLARLYEEGFGVSQNPAEAYKWYLIAARNGDAESRSAAQRLKSQLSPEAQSAAERSAQAFQAQGPHLGVTQIVAQATVSGGPADVTTAQRGLSRLGYYQGPYDGASSPALSLAIAAYQRDQGLPATGALDPTVTQRLQAASQ